MSLSRTNSNKNTNKEINKEVNREPIENPSRIVFNKVIITTHSATNAVNPTIIRISTEDVTNNEDIQTRNTDDGIQEAIDKVINNAMKANIQPTLELNGGGDWQRVLGSGQSMSVQLKKVIMNLKTYFQLSYPKWTPNRVITEIFNATKISENAIRRVFREVLANKNVLPPKSKARLNNGFKVTENDKLVMIKLMEQLKLQKNVSSVKNVFDLIRLEEYKELFQELSFKDCTYETFRRIFAKMGFRFRKINRKSQISSIKDIKK